MLLCSSVGVVLSLAAARVRERRVRGVQGILNDSSSLRLVRLTGEPGVELSVRGDYLLAVPFVRGSWSDCGRWKMEDVALIVGGRRIKRDRGSRVPSTTRRPFREAAGSNYCSLGFGLLLVVCA